MFKSLVPTLSIIVSLVLFIFVAKPQFNEAQTINADYTEYQDTIQKYEEFNAEINALKSKKNSIRISDRERIDAMIPSSIDNPRILVDLEALAKKHSLLFGNIKTDKGTEKVYTQTSNKNTSPEAQNSENRLLTNDISFDVIGTYDQFKNFLNDIESSLTIMEVKTISFDVTEGAFQQYSVTVQTYALPNIN